MRLLGLQSAQWAELELEEWLLAGEEWISDLSFDCYLSFCFFFFVFVFFSFSCQDRQGW